MNYLVIFQHWQVCIFLTLHVKYVGGLTGTVQVVATNPMEIVKIRLQMMQKQMVAQSAVVVNPSNGSATIAGGNIPVTAKSGAIQVIKDLGLSGLYRGSHITLMRDIPYGLLFFSLYADLKYRLRDPVTNITPFHNILAAGMLAGMFTAAVTTPFDALKTRYQSAEGANFKNFREVYHQTVAERGYLGLFRGWRPRAVIIGSLFAIMLLTYEVQKRLVTGTGDEN
jgi:solute carrier family 25 aspartate/glutamate transporter 12/13